MLTPTPRPELTVTGCYLSHESNHVTCGYCSGVLHDSDATDDWNHPQCEADANAEADALVELAGEDRQLLELMSVVRWAVRGLGEREAA